MKTIFSFTVATGLSLLLSILAFTADSKDPKLPEPRLGIEDALRISKAFVQKQNIAVAGQYIDSVHFKQEESGNRRKFWIVTWLRNENANDVAIKGGQTYVHIYMDGTAEVFYGE